MTNKEDRGELKGKIVFGIILYSISCLLLEFVFKGTGWHIWTKSWNVLRVMEG